MIKNQKIQIIIKKIKHFIRMNKTKIKNNLIIHFNNRLVYHK